LRVNYVTSDERWKCFTKGKGVLVHAIVKKGGAKRSKGFACPIRHKQKPMPQMNAFLKAMVELSGIEPLTSCMPCKRSPS
jgi:hypothetical protein